MLNAWANAVVGALRAAMCELIFFDDLARVASIHIRRHNLGESYSVAEVCEALCVAADHQHFLGLVIRETEKRLGV